MKNKSCIFSVLKSMFAGIKEKFVNFKYLELSQVRKVWEKL